jgi:hypothetical protein
MRFHQSYLSSHIPRPAAQRLLPIFNLRLRIRIQRLHLIASVEGLREKGGPKEGIMGLFWDLYQQSQISKHSERAGELEHRVATLETELRRTQEILHETIGRLETAIGKDINSDGRIG